ncbi:MAG: hypothetical protein KTR32_33895 [Granulosicoccus sp.]|nr:hypothetical protein [Granulosicoccus sp.]
MNLLTLIDSDDVLLASGKRVFSANETGALLSTVDAAQRMSEKLAECEEKIQASVVAAREEGYRDGRIAGMEDARNTLGTQLIQLNKQAEAELAEQRKETVRLALQIIRKIANNLAPEETIASLATTAAREYIEDPSLTLKVHPDRVDAVRDALSRQDTLAESKTIFSEILADASLGKEDCILDSRHGAIVADLETQLKTIELTLAQEA